MRHFSPSLAVVSVAPPSASLLLPAYSESLAAIQPIAAQPDPVEGGYWLEPARDVRGACLPDVHNRPGGLGRLSRFVRSAAGRREAMEPEGGGGGGGKEARAWRRPLRTAAGFLGANLLFW